MTKITIASFAMFTLASAWGLSPAGAAVEKYQVKGESASAYFSSVDPTGCVITDVSIWGSENVTREGPGAPTSATEVFASVSTWDQCNWTMLSSGYGSTKNADLSVNGTKSASLQTSLPIYDEISGTTSFLDIDLSWAGVGEVYRGHSTSHDRQGDVSFRYRSNGSSREAEVSGAVTLGGEVLSDGSGSGQLYVNQSGSMQITRR